jgi:hypothetical protein
MKPATKAALREEILRRMDRKLILSALTMAAAQVENMAKSSVWEQARTLWMKDASEYRSLIERIRGKTIVLKRAERAK